MCWSVGVFQRSILQADLCQAAFWTARLVFWVRQVAIFEAHAKAKILLKIILRWNYRSQSNNKWIDLRCWMCHWLKNWGTKRLIFYFSLMPNRWQCSCCWVEVWLHITCRTLSIIHNIAVPISLLNRPIMWWFASLKSLAYCIADDTNKLLFLFYCHKLVKTQVAV